MVHFEINYYKYISGKQLNDFLNTNLAHYYIISSIYMVSIPHTKTLMIFLNTDNDYQTNNDNKNMLSFLKNLFSRYDINHYIFNSLLNIRKINNDMINENGLSKWLNSIIEIKRYFCKEEINNTPLQTIKDEIITTIDNYKKADWNYV